MFLRHCLLLTLASVAAAPAAAAASVVAATAVAAMRIEAAVTCEAAVMCEAAAMCELAATDAMVLVSAVQAWAWAGTAWVAEVEPAQTEAGDGESDYGSVWGDEINAIRGPGRR